MRQSAPQPGLQRGTIFLTLLYGLPVLLAMVGLAVDFGQYYLMKRQTQTAADAGAWGGALQRARGITKNGQLDIDLIKNAAITDVDLNGFTITADKVLIPPQATLPPSIPAWSNNFVQVIVTQEVPTFLLWIISSDFQKLTVTASAIAGAISVPGPGCFMTLGGKTLGNETLTGDFVRQGNAEWNWEACDIYIAGFIAATGGGHLWAQNILCGKANCDKGGTDLRPEAEYTNPAPSDPWAQALNGKNFTAVTAGGVCNYVYRDTNAERFERNSPNIGFVSSANTLKLKQGIHCVMSADAWDPGNNPIDGTNGVSLYVNNGDETLSLPDKSRLIAMTKTQAAAYNADFQGLVLYGTGHFKLQGNETVYAHGAFYYPKGIFEVLSSAANLKHITSCPSNVCSGTYNPLLSSYAKCIQIVAGSLNLKGDVFDDIINSFECFDDKYQEPLAPPLQAIVQ